MTDPTVESRPCDADVRTLIRRMIRTMRAGDRDRARSQLDTARCVARTRARRDRQRVEIAAAVIDGSSIRAVGLAAEHRHEFPEDTALLDELL